MDWIGPRPQQLKEQRCMGLQQDTQQHRMSRGQGAGLVIVLDRQWQLVLLGDACMQEQAMHSEHSVTHPQAARQNCNAQADPGSCISK
jgi:hypothetical protein